VIGAGSGTVKSDRCYSQPEHNYSDSEKTVDQFADCAVLKYRLKYLRVSANANLLK